MLILKLNYYSHLLLNSRYSLLIKLIIIFSIYTLLYVDNSTDIVYCTQSNKKKLEKALKEIEHLQEEISCLQDAQQRLRTWAFVDPRPDNSVTFIREENLDTFKDRYYPLASYQHEYELSDGRIIRHYGGKTLERIHLGRNVNTWFDPFGGNVNRWFGFDPFYYIRINPDKIVYNTQEIYYPPNHPANGFKFNGEVARTYLNAYYEEEDIPWTLKICNIL